MLVPILLLLVFAGTQVDLAPTYKEIEAEVLPLLNNLRSMAASGEMTNLTMNFTETVMEKIEAMTANPNDEHDYYELLKYRFVKRRGNQFGPMANMKKLTWSEALQKISNEEKCPPVGGEQLIFDNNGTNVTYRLVSFALNYTGVQTLGQAVEKYFEYYIPRMETVHPTLLEEHHTTFIIGEFYVADRDEVGCTVHDSCSQLVCVLSPGEMQSEVFITGDPGSECPVNYVAEENTGLCIVDPRIRSTDISVIRNAAREGVEVPIMVALRQEEEDGAGQHFGALVLALVLFMTW